MRSNEVGASVTVIACASGIGKNVVFDWTKVLTDTAC
jgi:hypothetical protein